MLAQPCGGSLSETMSTNPMTPLTANVSRSQSDQLVTHWYAWFWLISSLIWPRLCLLAFWIFGSFMADAFNHSWVLQVAGFVLAPWTTMVFALVYVLPTNGVYGWEWICIGLALLADLATWLGGRSLVRGLAGHVS
jgi:hypothetical protein